MSNDPLLKNQNEINTARVCKREYEKPDVALFLLETEEIQNGAVHGLESQGTGYLS